MGRKLLDLVGWLSLPEFWEVSVGNADDFPPVEAVEDFAGRLGLQFSNPLLLSRALTHSSYMNEHPEALEDNERLEFLGDAILDFVVGTWLYHRFPEMNEGDLTRMRAALVKTEQLAEFGREINIGAPLRLGRGEEENGGRTRDAMLCATFEALVGALYLDSNVSAVEEFVSPLIQKAVGLILSGRKDRDPKSLLQEWAQAQGYSAPDYQVVTESGPDHDKSFFVKVVIDGIEYGSGYGHSKQSAGKAAALATLQKLNIK